MPYKTNLIVGALKHCALWLKSKNKDLTYENPNFNKDYKKGYVIYCVHGTADRNTAFTNFVENIIEELPDFVSSIKCLSFENRAQGESIEGFSRQLKAKIRKNGDKDVLLVGHSRGGLIASHYTENFAEQHNVNVHLVTTICSPYLGAFRIYWPIAAISKSVKQMMPKSDFLNELNEQVVNSNTKYIHISTTRDRIVTKGGSQPSLKSANVLLLENEGHISSVSAVETSNFFLEHLKMIPKPEHLEESQDDDEKYPSEILEALKNLQFHADTLPEDSAQNLKKRDQEGNQKQNEIEKLLTNIDEADTLEEIQELVNQALESQYLKAHQTNVLLINRGRTHLHWIHSLFYRKINTVCHRLSRSTTEDLLIDLKKAVDESVENSKQFYR